MEQLLPLAILTFILLCASLILLPWFVTLPFLALVVGGMVYQLKQRGYRAIWRNKRLMLTQEQEEFPEMAPPRLRLVTQSDRHFSAIHFLDFARLLYEEFLKARYTSDDAIKKLAHFIDPKLLETPPPYLGLELAGERKAASVDDGNVSPFLSSERRAPGEAGEETLGAAAPPPPSASLQRDGAPPLNICIGPPNIHTVDLGDPDIEVVFEFGSTIKRDLEQHDDQFSEVYICEQVVFKRSTNVISADAPQMRQLCCPTCDKPLDAKPPCEHEPKAGEKQWYIAEVKTLNYITCAEFDSKPAQTKGGSVIQSAVDAETLAEKEQKFFTENPQFSLDELKIFAKRCFLELLDAWSHKQWERARTFMTKSLHASFYIELERYKRNGWTNHMKDVEIKDVVPVKYAQDPHHHLITLWITAQAIDYTTDTEGKKIAGDDKHKIVFHEYWTFIRRRDVGAPGAETLVCPLCKNEVGPTAPRFCKHCADNFHDIEFEWTLAALGPDSTEWT